MIERASFCFAPFGGWHEGPAKLTVLMLARLWFCLALTSPNTRDVIYNAAPLLAPATQDPRQWVPAVSPCARPTARFNVHNIVLCSERRLHCHGHCDPGPRARPGQWPRQFAGILHATRPHSAACAVRRNDQAVNYAQEPANEVGRNPIHLLTFR